MYHDKVTVVNFPYVYNNITLKVFFFHLEDNVLIISNEQKGIFFDLIVDRHFNLPIKFKKSDYNHLLDVLDIKYDAENVFKPVDFIKDFISNIPDYESTDTKYSKKYIKYVNSYIEDGFKVNFIGFKNNTDGKHVSKENLNKTLLFMGNSQYERCRKNNISTIWSTKKR